MAEEGEVRFMIVEALDPKTLPVNCVVAELVMLPLAASYGQLLLAAVFSSLAMKLIVILPNLGLELIAAVAHVGI